MCNHKPNNGRDTFLDGPLTLRSIKSESILSKKYSALRSSDRLLYVLVAQILVRHDKYVPTCICSSIQLSFGSEKNLFQCAPILLSPGDRPNEIVQAPVTLQSVRDGHCPSCSMQHCSYDRVI